MVVGQHHLGASSGGFVFSFTFLFNRLRPTAKFLVAVVALFGGLLLFSLILPDDPAPSPDRAIEALQSAPLPILLVASVLVPIAEAAVFSIMFIEGAALARFSAQLGALAGVLAYSVLYHWSKGASGIVVSGWFIIVVNSMYLAMREYGVKTAFVGVVLLRWLYVAVAILLVRVLA
jgi:hypothetical protein